MRPYERRTVMEDHGFYVTLPCNASSSVYPENRISSYTTRLAKAINLKGQWEVGLAEIEYPRSWYNFNDEDGHFILHTAPEPPDSNPSNIGFSIITKLYISGGYYANIRAILRAINTAVKPAAVQKNTVKPAAIEINVRVYYNDYGNHRNNTEETRF